MTQTYPTTPGILAIIPCLNEEHHLEGLVHSLVKDANATSLAMRIAIVDGGSTDRTRMIAHDLAAQYPVVSVLHNPARIQSAAVNLAVAQADPDTEFVIRIDAHAGYPDQYCATLIEEQRETNAASVVVTMETTGTGWFQKAVAAAQNSKLGNGGSAHRNAPKNGAWVDHGHHALIRLDAFRALGGYDATFSHNEDAEFDIRLRNTGYKIWLTGKTGITYFPRSTPWSLFRQYFHFGRGRARTILKHRVMPRMRQLAPVAIAPAMALALIAPLWWIAVLPLLAWAGLCLAYGIMLGIRAKDFGIAASGPAAMIMHAAWSLGFWSILCRGFLSPTAYSLSPPGRGRGNCI